MAITRHCGRCGCAEMNGVDLLNTCPRSFFKMKMHAHESNKTSDAREEEKTNAVKSALPVAALAASGDSLVLQTAPLCPRKVPIQSPVHSLNIGLPSLQLETIK